MSNVDTTRGNTYDDFESDINIRSNSETPKQTVSNTLTHSLENREYCKFDNLELAMINS